MCFVIITLHSWLFLGKESSFSSPLFEQLQPIEINDFYIDFTPSVGKRQSEQEISGMCTYFLQVVTTMRN